MSLTSLTTEMPVLRSLWRAICYFELLSSCIHVILSMTLVQACRSPLVAKGAKCQPPWLTSKTSKVHIHSIKYRFSKLLKLCYIVWLPVSCGLTSNKWTTLKQLPRYITVHFISQETVFLESERDPHTFINSGLFCTGQIPSFPERLPQWMDLHVWFGTDFCSGCPSWRNPQAT